MERIIINEFMNHFYTPSQLSIFLDVPTETIESILNDKQLVTAILGKDGVKKVNQHMERINLWIYSSSTRPYLIESDYDREIVEIANYIVDNNASIRDASDHFGIPKTTIHERMEGRLSKISIILYKKVFDVIKSKKSLKVNESLANYDTIYYEYELLLSGHTIEDIAKILGLSRQRVQRDLANRISLIDIKMAERSNSQLFENQMKPLYENQFRKKHTLQ